MNDTSYSPTNPVSAESSASRLQKIILAIAFTAILSFNLNISSSHSVGRSSTTTIATDPVPEVVLNTALADAAQRLQVKRSQLQVIATVPTDDNGWSVTVSNGRQQWQYRTDRQGAIVEIESEAN